jgi:hypothetical protein
MCSVRFVKADDLGVSVRGMQLHGTVASGWDPDRLQDNGRGEAITTQPIDGVLSAKISAISG